MLAKTHPDQASPVDPLFGFAGKRVKKGNFEFFNALFPTQLKRGTSGAASTG
jgi:hypothetical protein